MRCQHDWDGHFQRQYRNMRLTALENPPYCEGIRSPHLSGESSAVNLRLLEEMGVEVRPTHPEPCVPSAGRVVGWLWLWWDIWGCGEWRAAGTGLPPTAVFLGAIVGGLPLDQVWPLQGGRASLELDPCPRTQPVESLWSEFQGLGASPTPQGLEGSRSLENPQKRPRESESGLSIGWSVDCKAVCAGEEEVCLHVRETTVVTHSRS